MGAGKNRGSSPDGADLLDAATYIGRELDGSLRVVMVHKHHPVHMFAFEITLQLIRQWEGKTWVMAERMFVWPNNEGRDLMATVQIETHRAFHKWGMLAFKPLARPGAQ